MSSDEIDETELKDAGISEVDTATGDILVEDDVAELVDDPLLTDEEKNTKEDEDDEYAEIQDYMFNGLYDSAE